MLLEKFFRFRIPGRHFFAENQESGDTQHGSDREYDPNWKTDTNQEISYNGNDGDCHCVTNLCLNVVH
ncbi:MAG: hypothetical protein PHW61_07180, partial [Eubacteriales bacterium]|nr:hypothetical protein [Eubacteriales bacterium]